MSFSVSIPGPLRPARFVARPNQFTVHVRLELEQEVVAAHLPDPGRLRSLLIEDRPLWIRPVEESKHRKTRFTAAIVQSEEGTLVSVDTLLPNRLIRSALEDGAIDELSGWRLAGREVAAGRSRFDFVMESPSGKRMYVEVKSVTMRERNVGFFPDAPTERGTRHVRELTALAQRDDTEAAILFVAQRVDVDAVAAAAGIDPQFAQALDEARGAGVRVFARRCQVTLEELLLGMAIPVM